MFKERLQKFSIRKLTVGAASVLIGTAFFVSGNNSEVKADTNSSDTTTEQQETQPTQLTRETTNAGKRQSNSGTGAPSGNHNNQSAGNNGQPSNSNLGDSNNRLTDEKGRLPFDGKENRPFVSSDTSEQIAGDVQNDKTTGNVIMTTKSTDGFTFTADNYVESNIYLVNSNNDTYTVYIYMPNVIQSDATKDQPELAKQDVLKFIGENLLKDYNYNYNYNNPEAFKNKYDDLLKTGKLIKIDSIYEGRYSRTKKDDVNVKKLIASDNTGITITDSDVNNAYDAYANISDKLKTFFEVDDLASLKLLATADDDANDPQNNDYPGPDKSLRAAAHGIFTQVDDAGLDYPGNPTPTPDTPNTTPDTPNTTPDTPNTDNNGDQGKKTNTSHKGDNDKQDHGNKGTGSATSTNTNTGRNTGSVTKIDNSGAGSNKSVNGNNDNELPQTGEKETSMSSVLGLAAISLGALMGLAVDRKKKRN